MKWLPAERLLNLHYYYSNMTVKLSISRPTGSGQFAASSLPHQDCLVHDLQQSEWSCYHVENHLNSRKTRQIMRFHRYIQHSCIHLSWNWDLLNTCYFWTAVCGFNSQFEPGFICWWTTVLIVSGYWLSLQSADHPTPRTQGAHMDTMVREGTRTKTSQD